ncbi:hypothetical protein ACH4T9_00635 [Micromonospora sp. NPDC020750]|uniref:hypothetical protein n=1 Tax=unclassified Micromonospora TaxID=2617518 RepID=UPI0037AE1EF6
MRTATVLTAGRWARLALLICTLVGLAAMHTLGHGAHGGEGHGGHDRAGSPDAHPAASYRATTMGGAPAVTAMTGAALPVAIGAAFHAAGAALHTADAALHTAGAAFHATDVTFQAADAAGAALPVADGGAGAVLRVGVTRVGAMRMLPEGCPVAGCPSARLLPAGDPGAGPPGWSICLAVLGALAVALFVAVLLLSGVRSVGPSARRPAGPPAGPRAPPPRPIGLWLAEISVSRT